MGRVGSNFGVFPNQIDTPPGAHAPPLLLEGNVAVEIRSCRNPLYQEGWRVSAGVCVVDPSKDCAPNLKML